MAICKMTIGATTGPVGARKRVDVGTVEYFLPTLDLFGLDAPTSFNEDGNPVYGDEKLDWLQSAVTFKVQSAVRNLAKASEDLKSIELVRPIPSSLEELMEGGQGSSYFEVKKLALALFTAWVAKLDSSPEGKARLVRYFSNMDALTEAASAVKAKLAERINAFVASLTEEEAASIVSYLRNVKGALESVPATDAGVFE